MKPVSAMGKRGILISDMDGKFCFRIYDDEHNFVDYRIAHSDLVVTIQDDDAYLYEGSDGSTWLDYGLRTLGKEE